MRSRPRRRIGRRARHVTEAYVSREPLKAIGIAAAVGAIVALVLVRR